MGARVVFDEATDVLVVGSGLTGLMSAIAAQETGASVCIVTPKRLGRDSSSAMSTGGVAASFTERGDDPEVHADDTLRSGQELSDPDLVGVLCRGSSDAVQYARRLGSRFVEESGELRFSPSAEHSWPRSLEALHHMGTSYTVPLAEHIRSTGTHIAEFHLLEGLLLDPDRNEVVGAQLLDLKQRTRRIVRTSAVVLATGGCGQLFSLTSNPIDIYGIGYSVGARAGAILRDMEFIQFYPYRCVDPFSKSRVAIQPSTFIVGGELFNSHGERFMASDDPVRKEATTRDVAARAIYKQIVEGNDVKGGVRLDLSRVSPTDLLATNYRVVRALARKGVDPKTYPFIIRPEAHYYMGGLEIDVQSRTSINGLFAAGEVAGGIHGANRLTNNSLADSLVFGRRSGLFAAEHARSAKDNRLVKSMVCASTVSPPPKSGRRVTEVSVDSIKKCAWESLGLIRENSTLVAGRDTFLQFSEYHAADGYMYRHDAPRWIRTQSLIDTALLSLTAALDRRESRGAHYRSDFPHAGRPPCRPIRLAVEAEGGSYRPQIAHRVSNPDENE